jgi:uncharacterized protein (TIRG00374 family)
MGNAKRLNLMLLGGGVAVLTLLYRHYGVAPVAAALSRLRPGTLLAYVVVACAVRAAYSLRWSLMATRLGPVPSFWRFVSARLAGDAVGTLMPLGRVGGDPLRVAMLYGEGVGGRYAGAGVVIDRVLEVIGNSVAALAYIALLAVAHTLGTGARATGLVVGALLLSIGGLGVLLMQLRVGQRPLTRLCVAVGLRGAGGGRWLEVLRRTEDDVGRVCAEQPGLLAWGVAGSLLIEAVIVLEYLLLFGTFGVWLDISTLVMVLVATGLVRAVPVPASVGTLEASQVALLAAAHGQPELGLIVGTVLRLHETLWIVAGLAALSTRGVSLARLRAVSSSRAPA